MNQNEQADIEYMKEQIMILGVHAWRDAHGTEAIQEFAEAVRFAYSDSTNPEAYIAALHTLSSLVDKTKSGGWIADRTAVYRVERAGRAYRNTDLISVQMENKDHNGAEGLFARAREVAAALNSL